LDVLNILLVRHPEKILDSENATLDLHPDLTQTPTLARAQSFYLIVREIVRSEIDERQNNQMEPLIEALARERPNLCTIVLQDLIQASILQSSNGTSATLLNSLIRIVTHTEDNNLLAVSYELLAKIVENRGELKLSTNIALSLLDSSLRTHKTRSPVVVAGAVRVLGFVLDASCSEVAFTKDVSRALQGLFYNIRIMINENSVSVHIIISLLPALTFNSHLINDMPRLVALTGFAICGGIRWSLIGTRCCMRMLCCWRTTVSTTTTRISELLLHRRPGAL